MNDKENLRKNIIIHSGQSLLKKKLAKEFRDNPTPAEHHLWQYLRGNQLEGWHFRRQQIIDGYIVDFYYHPVGLVIEIDGPIHQSQQEYDHKREMALQERGLTILRFSNEEVMGAVGTVLNKIIRTCHALEREPE